MFSVIFFAQNGEPKTTTLNEVMALANGRNMMMMGIASLALGIYVGNTMKKGSITRQVRSTGRTLMRRARGTVEQQMNNWME